MCPLRHPDACSHPTEPQKDNKPHAFWSKAGLLAFSSLPRSPKRPVKDWGGGGGDGGAAVLTAPGHRPTQRRVLNSVGLSNTFALSLCLCSFHFSEMFLVQLKPLHGRDRDLGQVQARVRGQAGAWRKLEGRGRRVSQGGKQPQADGDKWTGRED